MEPQRRLAPRGRPHAAQGRDRIHAPGHPRAAGSPPPVAGGPPQPPHRPGRLRTPAPLIAVRYGVPALIVLAGAVALCFGTEDSFYGGVSLIGAGLAVALINWFYRVGVRGDADRDSEDAARRYFDRFGRWPDDRR